MHHLNIIITQLASARDFAHVKVDILSHGKLWLLSVEPWIHLLGRAVLLGFSIRNSQKAKPLDTRLISSRSCRIAVPLDYESEGRGSTSALRTDLCTIIPPVVTEIQSGLLCFFVVPQINSSEKISAIEKLVFQLYMYGLNLWWTCNGEYLSTWQSQMVANLIL